MKLLHGLCHRAESDAQQVVLMDVTRFDPARVCGSVRCWLTKVVKSKHREATRRRSVASAAAQALSGQCGTQAPAPFPPPRAEGKGASGEHTARKHAGQPDVVPSRPRVCGSAPSPTSPFRATARQQPLRSRVRREAGGAGEQCKELSSIKLD